MEVSFSIPQENFQNFLWLGFPRAKKNFIFLLTKNFSVIVTFGIMGMIVGTYVSIDQLVTDLSGGGNDTCVPANSTGFHSVWYPPKLV